MIVGIFANNQSSRDTIEKPADYVAPDAPITLVNGNEVFNFLKSDIQFDALRRDLNAYASTQLHDKSDLMLFTVKSTSTVSDVILQITGTYNSEKTVYIVTVERLANERLKVDIKDQDGQQSQTIDLPSNSKANQFAATLPIENTRYRIDYIASTNSFIVYYYTNDPSAIDEVETMLNNHELAKSSVEFVYPKQDPQFED